MDLLSINEIFGEIKKLKVYVDKLKRTGYPERNKINASKRAIDVINKLNKLYLSKTAE